MASVIATESAGIATFNDAVAPPPMRERARRLTGGVREESLGEPELITIRRLINVHGVQAVARMLDVPATTIANAGAGAGLRRANRLLLTARLRELRPTP